MIRFLYVCYRNTAKMAHCNGNLISVIVSQMLSENFP